MQLLQVLLDEEPGAGELPPPLAGLYGGDLALPAEVLYANAISSLDGVVALAAPRGAGRTLRGEADAGADRFVMGLLRFLADAVVIGAGTLRADRGHLWTPAYIDRERADLYRSLGRAEPRLVVVTASGELDPAERALEAGALVLTTDAGAGRLRRRLPTATAVRSLGATPPAAASIAAAVRDEGHRRVLVEGGPRLLARFAAERALDELFLTLSPVLAGRRSGDGRLGLLEGVQLLPADGRWARLRSVRRAGSHLFLRYGLGDYPPSRSGAE
ncbi:MAG TPA: dihydrofolate reductase family protein [Candidatus Dormibacteraeota bacterium]|nr:dihydrofolate reductase family protein [Candidatus Dormibacteraeota bacterium]